MFTPDLADFCVVTARGRVGKAISTLEWLDQRLRGDKENSKYIHAALYVGNGLIVEAEPGGAILSPWDKYGDAALWSTCRLKPAPTPTQRATIAAAGRSFGPQPDGTPGIGYSYGDYLAELTHTLHLWPIDKMLKGYIASFNHMDCSQLVDSAYDVGFYHLFNDGRWPGYVSPAELAGLLQ